MRTVSVEGLPPVSTQSFSSGLPVPHIAPQVFEREGMPRLPHDAPPEQNLHDARYPALSQSAISTAPGSSTSGANAPASSLPSNSYQNFEALFGPRPVADPSTPAPRGAPSGTLPASYIAHPHGELTHSIDTRSMLVDAKGQRYISDGGNLYGIRYDAANKTWRVVQPEDTAKPGIPVNQDRNGRWQIHSEAGLRGGGGFPEKSGFDWAHQDHINLQQQQRAQLESEQQQLQQQRQQLQLELNQVPNQLHRTPLERAHLQQMVLQRIQHVDQRLQHINQQLQLLPH